MKDAVKKVFIDQFVFAPVLVAILVPLFGFSQGMDRVQVREKVDKVSFLKYYDHLYSDYIFIWN